jgi:hypothetical protein
VGQVAVELDREVGELSRVLGDGQGSIACEYGEACAVVAAVFELSETIEDDSRRFTWAGIANDSTHAVLQAAQDRAHCINSAGFRDDRD